MVTLAFKNFPDSLARSAVGLKSPSPDLQMGQTAAQASGT